MGEKKHRWSCRSLTTYYQKRSMIKSGAYLSHGSEMLSKLYTVCERMTGLIPYIIWSFMESPAALCVAQRGAHRTH